MAQPKNPSLPPGLEQEDHDVYVYQATATRFTVPRPYYSISTNKIIYIAPIRILTSSNIDFLIDLIPVKETPTIKALYGNDSGNN